LEPDSLGLPRRWSGSAAGPALLPASDGREDRGHQGERTSADTRTCMLSRLLRRVNPAAGR